MKLDDAPGQPIWAYRKAAWAIEDLEQDISLVYRFMPEQAVSHFPIEPDCPNFLRKAIDIPAKSLYNVDRFVIPCDRVTAVCSHAGTGR
jgi:hypothetical protein